MRKVLREKFDHAVTTNSSSGDLNLAQPEGSLCFGDKSMLRIAYDLSSDPYKCNNWEALKLLFMEETPEFQLVKARLASLEANKMKTD